MVANDENEKPMFNENTLRLVVGALAFGLPCLVYVLVGRMTRSISSAYHELPTRDIFVGSLFVIGTLLISYKGHRQGELPEDGVGFWKWLVKLLDRYQEDLISTAGGVAAMTAALLPTACDTCTMDTISYIHMLSAFILFANVAYFSIVAFLRSINKKLLAEPDLKDDVELRSKVEAIRTKKTFNPLLLVSKVLFLEVKIFRAITREKLAQYKVEKADKWFAQLWSVYGKKFARGLVYVLFGSLTVLVLLVSVVLGVLIALKVIPDGLTTTAITFVIEAIAMFFFGVTWVTASQMEYWRQIRGFWERLWQRQPVVTQPGTP